MRHTNLSNTLKKIRELPSIHRGDPPPSKSNKTLYTDIYLPTFQEGTNFIIKLLVSCLGALTGPRETPPGIYNGIYTGIYLPTFREGTHFMIKTVSFVSGGPYGPRGFLSDFEGGGGGSPRCIIGKSRTLEELLGNHGTFCLSMIRKNI